MVDLSSFRFKPVQGDFQLDFARMTDETGIFVVLSVVGFPF